MIKNLLKTSFSRFALLLVLGTGIVCSCNVGDTSKDPDTRLTLNVDQFILNSDGTVFSYGTNKTSPVLSVTANLGYVATSDANWLTPDPAEGRGVTNMTIEAAENTSGQQRTGIITITSKERSLKITVIQNAD